MEYIGVRTHLLTFYKLPGTSKWDDPPRYPTNSCLVKAPELDHSVSSDVVLESRKKLRVFLVRLEKPKQWGKIKYMDNVFLRNSEDVWEI